MRILQVKMDNELHKRFKLACVCQEKEMSELVRAWITKYVEQVEKKKKT